MSNTLFMRGKFSAFLLRNKKKVVLCNFTNKEAKKRFGTSPCNSIGGEIASELILICGDWKPVAALSFRSTLLPHFGEAYPLFIFIIEQIISRLWGIPAS